MECIQEDFVEKSQKISIYMNRYINQIKFLEERIEKIQNHLDPMQKEYLEQYKMNVDKKQNQQKLNEMRSQIEKMQRDYLTFSYEKMTIADQIVELNQESQQLFQQYKRLIDPFNIQDIMEEEKQIIKPVQEQKVNKKLIVPKQVQIPKQQIQVPLNLPQQTEFIQEKPYCICGGAIQEIEMIACDRKGCKIEWFHYSCVGITEPPTGDWYCTDCQKKKKKNQQKVKK